MSNYSNREFSEFEKDVFYDVIFSRRDVRQNFIVKKIEDNVLLRILKAAHHAPSVGFSQPWNFILIKNNCINLFIKKDYIFDVCFFLKNSMFIFCNQLLDITLVDRIEFVKTNFRWEFIYVLLSTFLNKRIFVRGFLKNFNFLVSIVKIFNSAN